MGYGTKPKSKISHLSDFVPQNPREAVVHSMIEREHWEPGFLDKIYHEVRTNGHVKFSNDHFVTLHGGLFRIMDKNEFDEHTKQTDSTFVQPYQPDFSDEDVPKATLKNRVINKVKKLFAKAIASKATQTMLGQISTGKTVFRANNDVNFKRRYAEFSNDEHNEAAGMHFNAAQKHHAAKDFDARDDAMTEGLEHMSRSNSKNHHKLYSKLMNEYYGEL